MKFKTTFVHRLRFANLRLATADIFLSLCLKHLVSPAVPTNPHLTKREKKNLYGRNMMSLTFPGKRTSAQPFIHGSKWHIFYPYTRLRQHAKDPPPLLLFILHKLIGRDRAEAPVGLVLKEKLFFPKKEKIIRILSNKKRETGRGKTNHRNCMIRVQYLQT